MNELLLLIASIFFFAAGFILLWGLVDDVFAKTDMRKSLREIIFMLAMIIGGVVLFTAFFANKIY